MDKKNQNQEAPAQSQKDNVPDNQQAVKEPKQTHEDRVNPRQDHGTDHLGYNRTHLDTNPGPVVEGSDKI
jgi:hypothetical protein